MKHTLSKILICSFIICSMGQSMEKKDELDIKGTRSFVENNDHKNKELNLKILDDQLSLEELQNYLTRKNITSPEKLFEYDYVPQEHTLNSWNDPKFLSLIAKHLMTFDYANYETSKTNVDFWPLIQNYYSK